MGYYWSREQEKKLISLWNGGQHDVRILGEQLNRKPEAVRKKVMRLGLLVVDQEEKIKRTTTIGNEERTRIELDIPDELPSVEEALKVLVAALKALEDPGLSKTEILRLRSIVSTVKVYQKLVAEYVDYRGLEVQLEDLTQKYESLTQRSKRVISGWPRIIRSSGDKPVVAVAVLPGSKPARHRTSRGGGENHD